VDGLTDAIELAAGATHTCAVTAQRKLLCWGNNVFGNLGVVTSSSWTAAVQEVPIQALPQALIASLGNGGCARLADNRFSCWGDNRYGQQVPGSSEQRTGPTLVELALPGN
jgi:alpha-tubulin suppressor-like RCC1 family protein